MKIKLLILFSFFVTICNAQREVLTDTLYITNESGKIFIYSYKEFTDGSRAGNFPNGGYRETAPDSATAVNYILGEALNKARQYASVSQQALQKGKVVAALTTLNTAVVNFTGISLLDSLRNQIAPQLIGDDWTFKTSPGAQATPASLTKNAQGLLRIDLGGGVTRTLVPLAETWFRLLNYPSPGSNTDFYFMPSGSFIAIGENTSRTFTLRKASIAAQLQAQK